MGGLVVDDSPMLGLAQVFCYLLKHVEVDIVGASAELRKGYRAVAHIGTAGDIGIEEFPWESPITKAMLSLEFSVLAGAFGGSRVATHGIDGIIWERSAMLGGVGGGVPAMGLENPFNVAFRGEDNAVIKLLDVKPVEVCEET